MQSPTTGNTSSTLYRTPENTKINSIISYISIVIVIITLLVVCIITIVNVLKKNGSADVIIRAWAAFLVIAVFALIIKKV